VRGSEADKRKRKGRKRGGRSLAKVSKKTNKDQKNKIDG
jgi:hypothetical protein